MRTTLLAAAAALVASVGSAQAPAFVSDVSNNNSFHGPTPSYPFNTPSYTPTPHSPIEHHASTVIGDTGKAVAAIMKAYADGMISLSQAEILKQEAIARGYQNRTNNTETYLERKRLLEDYRDEQRLRSWERMERGAMRQAARDETVVYQEYLLLPEELDFATGEIDWPLAFYRPRFAPQMKKIQELYFKLASDDGLFAGRFQNRIEKYCVEFTRLLREEAHILNRDELLLCQRFVRGLKYEARYWRNADGTSLSLASHYRP